MPRASRPRSSPRATYLYSLLERAAEPDGAGAPAGLPGMGPLRWLAVGEGLWLAAADAPLERYDTKAIEKGLKDLEWVSACAVAHERVVEHVSGLGTAIPMKLFTLFTSDARAVAHVARSRRRLRALLRQLAGRQEWGIRVSVDDAQARTAARQRAERAAEGLTTGARFLTLKGRENREVREIVDRGRVEAETVFADAERHADQTRRREPAAAEPGLRLLLDAAFLVSVESAAAFREAVRRHAERLAPRGYRVVLTGPWPAYNFVAGAP
jgi:Gas vesicle synthesis protein GvpL/GvpF